MEGAISHDGDMFKLTADNYTYWKPMMEDHLYCKDFHEPITQKDKPEKKTATEWETENRKTVAMIRKYIDRSLFEHVSTYTNAYELWTKLESLIQKKTPRNKAHLVRRLVKLEYSDGQNMIEHLNTFKGIVNQLTKTEMKIDDELQTLLLLSSLPESWDTLVVTLSNSAPDGKLSMDSVTDCLLNEESRRRERGLNNQFEANVIDNRGRSKNREKGGREKSRGRSKTRTKLSCYYCGKPGHRKFECRFFKRDQQAGTIHPDIIDSKKKEEGTTTAVVATNENFFLVEDENYLNVASDDCIWIIDSGASFHVTPHEEFFSSYQKGDFGMVKMGNHVTSKIVGIGEVTLVTDNGSKLMLKEVRHVPDMRLNLISTGKLDDIGMINQFGDGKWKLSKGSMIIARGKKEGSLYVMQGKINKGDINVSQGMSKELWHKRLGHMSEKGLEILAKNHLPNIKGQPLESCEDCLAGKQHRVSFQRSDDAKRRKHILDLVHSDVCSTSERSLGGSQYFVTFIDDHSRKVWVYPLKTKDQVLQVFKEFHASVERASGRKLKCLRTDNGGEYIGTFAAYCKSHGIRHEKVPPKTPQMNGVAERMNRTIAEKVRSMLSQAKLPKSFWGEAVRTAVDLINLSPSRPLNGEIPDEIWYGKKASYGHLRVFGCRAFVHVPKDERAKLDAKTKECIYLGSPRDELGFRLWDPATKKMVRSRDVVFYEDQTIHDIQSKKPKTIVVQNSRGEIPQMNYDHDQLTEPNQMEEPDQIEQNQAMHEEQMAYDDVDVEMEQEPQLRRSTRSRQPSRRYFSGEYVNFTEEGEPQSFMEAIEITNKEKWLQSMEEEMKSLKENETYDLVKLPDGKRALKNKWVFKLKSEENNPNPRYKARIVVKGCHQKKGIDFEEIFSPVVKMTSIRAILGLAAKLDLEIEQLDVKTAFLHGDLEEEIYMEQPEGFVEPGKEHLVCRLKKSLYGLKQAPRQWYKKFDLFMTQHNFTKTSADHCVFVKNYENGESIILLLYVDDMLIVGKDKAKIAALKKALSKSFAMKDLGAVKKILGMKIIRDRLKRMLWMSQEEYLKKVLERFNMHNAKPVHVPLPGHLKLSKTQCPENDQEKEEMSKVPYSSAVGSLMYAMVCTRPDIGYAVGVVSRFLSNPGKEHWSAVKWILRYLKGTAKKCLCFGNGNQMLVGYVDADMAGDVDSRKSTSGYLITFAGGAVSWQSRLQKCVALSTTEAEYIAITEGCKEMMWMKKFLQELGQNQESYVLYCDSQSAIHLSKNSTYHSRSKHIDVRYHWIRDVLENKLLQIEKIHTNDNGADMMTKALSKEKIEFCKEAAGIAATPN